MNYPKAKTVEALERGGETELAFFQAMQCPIWKSPYWFKHTRRATHEEDRNGTDAIAVLDVGEVPIQIKTSHAGRISHESHYGKGIIVIVISPFMTHEEIRHLICDKLYVTRGYRIRAQQKKKGTRR